LLPIMPPIVQRVCVEGSGPNLSPSGVALACSRAWTTPGSTTAVRLSASTDLIRLRYLLVSSTMPGPIAFPAIEVPAPRIVRGTPYSRPIASVAAISSVDRGRTTTRGGIR